MSWHLTSKLMMKGYTDGEDYQAGIMLKSYHIEAMDSLGRVVKVMLWAEGSEHANRRFLLTFGPTFCVYHNLPAPFGGKVSPEKQSFEVVGSFAGFSPA